MSGAAQLREFGQVVAPLKYTFKNVYITGVGNDNGLDFEDLSVSTVLPGRVWILNKDLDRDRGLKKGMILTLRDKHTKRNAAVTMVATHNDIFGALRAARDIRRYVEGPELERLVTALKETEGFWTASWTLHMEGDARRRGYTEDVLWTACSFPQGVRDERKKTVRRRLFAASSPIDKIGRRNNGRLPLMFASVQNTLRDLQKSALSIGYAYKARQLGLAIYLDQCIALLDLVERIAEQATLSPTICGHKSTPKKRNETADRLTFFVQELVAVHLPRPFVNLKAHWVADFLLARDALLNNHLFAVKVDFDRIRRSCKGFRFRLDIEDARVILSRLPASRPLTDQQADSFVTLVNEVCGDMTQLSLDGKLFDFDFENRYVMDIVKNLTNVARMVDMEAPVSKIKEELALACAHF